MSPNPRLTVTINTDTLSSSHGLFNSLQNLDNNLHTVTRASGDVITYKKHFLANGILKTEKTLATGDIIVYESTINDSISSTTTCGQKSTNTYLLKNGTLAKDPLTNKRYNAPQSQDH